jgi:hypothetical protein
MLMSELLEIAETMEMERDLHNFMHNNANAIEWDGVTYAEDGIDIAKIGRYVNNMNNKTNTADFTLIKR